ncbi:MAG: biofilm PGA synthesis protein PgaB [Verrucomicrobiae bacterium]|nr:biofilm PGA synthesis protein PgaB [Verrucomicrobiae bacterium]
MKGILQIGWQKGSRRRILALAFPLLWLGVGAGAEAEEGKPATSVRVGLYVDAGTGDSREKVASAVKLDPDCNVTRLTAADIQAGKLRDIDVLIHPGGSASGQGKALGETGRAEVRSFVEKGGGYLGFCAGAYLATNDYSWSLGLIDAKVVDRKHWARGKGPVTVSLSPTGKSLLGADAEEVTFYYAQGPLLARREWPDQKTPAYESLGLFASEIAKNGAPSGIMAGTTAVARAEFGQGRVFCFSPHPELTEGIESFVARAVRWVAKRD